MKDEKEINNEDLSEATGGNDLDKYLKTLTEKDKEKLIIDYGTGVELKTIPSFKHEEGGNVEIIKREKDNS